MGRSIFGVGWWAQREAKYFWFAKNLQGGPETDLSHGKTHLNISYNNFSLPLERSRTRASVARYCFSLTSSFRSSSLASPSSFLHFRETLNLRRRLFLLSRPMYGEVAVPRASPRRRARWYIHVFAGAPWCAIAKIAGEVKTAIIIVVVASFPRIPLIVHPTPSWTLKQRQRRRILFSNVVFVILVSGNIYTYRELRDTLLLYWSPEEIRQRQI